MPHVPDGAQPLAIVHDAPAYRARLFISATVACVPYGDDTPAPAVPVLQNELVMFGWVDPAAGFRTVPKSPPPPPLGKEVTEMNKTEKETAVRELHEKMSKATFVAAVAFEKLDAQTAIDLRKAMRNATAAIMTHQMEFFMAELFHDLDHVLCHRALGIIAVIRQSLGLG